MKWKKYTIHTTTEAEDLVSMMLIELGVEGVQIEDNVPLSENDTKGMFIDILPELPPDDGSSKVSFFLHLDETVDDGPACSGTDDAGVSIDADNAEIAGKSPVPPVSIPTPAPGTADSSYTIADRLWTTDEITGLLSDILKKLDNMRSYIDIGEGTVEEGLTEDTDWRDSWKQFFKPFRTGSFLIKPSWEEVPPEYADDLISGRLRLIAIDPGTAFGTGSHETTRLCLGAIERFVSSSDNVLDIGTGSGILGIAALKYGAGSVTATELDPQCESAVLDNTCINGIGNDSFRLLIGNIIDDGELRREVHEAVAGGLYDIAVANILAPVICTLASPGQADTFVRGKGIFITSGILDERLEDVKQAFSNNPSWEILRIDTLGEWCSVIARRS